MTTNTKESGFDPIHVNWLVSKMAKDKEQTQTTTRNTPLMRLVFFGSSRIHSQSN